MTIRRRPKGPGGGQFAPNAHQEADMSLDIERAIEDAMSEHTQAPRPKTEEMKETRLGSTLAEMAQLFALAERFVADGRANMVRNLERRMAIERLFEVLGEQVKRLPDRYKREHPDVDWKAVIGFRDRLSHGYGGEIDEEILWHVLSSDLPTMRSALKI